MIISGTIQQVSPPDYTDKYSNQYQNITVNTPQGMVTGRIAAKNPYALQDIGKQGQWDIEQASNLQGQYNKLKKHYDQPYQGGQQAVAPPQAALERSGLPAAPPQSAVYSPQAPVSIPKPPNGEPNMYIIRGNALNAIFSAADIPLDMVKDYLLAAVQFILSGEWKLTPSTSLSKKLPSENDDDYDEAPFPPKDDGAPY